MSGFGEYLLSKGVLGQPELEETLRYQNVYGGRLGTNLIDSGFTVMSELAAHLSDYHGVPLPPPEWIEAPDQKAIDLIPMLLIRRCKVLPLRLEQRRIHMAMLDPKNPEQLEFLELAAGRSVVPYVLPETRLLYWLEIHLGIDRHPRLVNLGGRARQIGFDDGVASAGAPQPIDATPEPLPPLAPLARAPAPTELDQPRALQPPAPGPVPAGDELESEEILLLEELVSGPAESEAWDLPDHAPQPMPMTDGASGRIANLEAQLDSAGDRDEIIRVGLEIASAYASATALFLVRAGAISGYRAHGEGMDERLRGIEIPTETISIFAHPALTRTPFRGEPPEGGIDGRLIDALGRGDSQEVFVHPIVIRDRVVNLLYADNGPDAFGETSVAALTALCDCFSRAYHRLILETKKRD